MLRCPSCGTRVTGADLVSGICSRCHSRLSDENDHSELESDTLDTMLSDPGIADSAAASNDSLDLSGAANPSSASLAQPEKPLPEKPSDSAMATPVLPGESISPPLRTLDASAVESAPMESLKKDLGAQGSPVAGRETPDEFDNGGRTMVIADSSVFFADSADIVVLPEGSGSMGDSAEDSSSIGQTRASDDEDVRMVTEESIDLSGSVDLSGPGDQTMISDEFPDPAGGPAHGETSDDFLPAKPAAQTLAIGTPEGEADDSYMATYVADDEAERVQQERAEAGATYVGPEFADLESGDTAATFVSDDVPEAIIKTIASVWGDEPSGNDVKPVTSLKGREVKRIPGPRQTLVIKHRSLTHGPGPKVGSDQAEYEVIRILGEGGMGVVYEARQTSVDREVAVKMLKSASAKNERQRQKFLAEAVVTGDLEHPNIVPIYDVGSAKDGSLFYSMKKVQGTPWLKVISKKSLIENLEILLKVADAVAFAHARGVIHRDLKPENVMLGEFGEVLVMDWGLAQPSAAFRRKDSIVENTTMGGTPAYMAPEMATGPITKVTPQSDVYLLGAILFEILTDMPPHAGKTAMKCLMAAARNEIVETDQEGELIAIALKAMATDPNDRYQSVMDFQASIREYLSHSESVQMTVRAEDDLSEAGRLGGYEGFAKALFGFEEAVELWDGNLRAKQGERKARLAYANFAIEKGDYDLAKSLLHPTDAEHQPLIKLIDEAVAEREGRQQRIRLLRRTASVLVGAVVVVVTIAFFWIRAEANRAMLAEKEATKQRDVAVKNEQEAKLARDDAEARRKEAELAKEQAIIARTAAQTAEMQAREAQSVSERERAKAELARMAAEKAKASEEYEAYIARIGLASAKINENAFATAKELLLDCPTYLRNWEWGRLMHLCSQQSKQIQAGSPLDALDIQHEKGLFATGGWDGTARIFQLKDGAPKSVLKTQGQYVHAVAFQPQGDLIALGGSEAGAYLQLWSVESGERVRILKGHADGVLSVEFSRDGKQLLSTSYDKSIRLWDVETGEVVRTFEGHNWWVWSARFSPDGKRIVSAGQDGIVLVWDVESGRHLPPFTGHEGPVFTATFDPSGKYVASGGYDRTIQIWSPANIQPFDFRRVAEEVEESSEKALLELSAEQRSEAKILKGHEGAVRALHFSRDGGLLLSGAQDNTARLWELPQGRATLVLRGHDGWVRACDFSLGDRQILTASYDSTVCEWSTDRYEEFRVLNGRVFEGHEDAVLSAAWAPNQQSIVTAGRDRTARTWNVETGDKQLQFKEGHEFLASKAIFFDGGKRLATAGVDNTLRLWEVETGSQTKLLEHTGRSAAFDISTDGKWLVTGSDRKVVVLRDLSTLETIFELTGHQHEPTAVAISPDGKTILSGDLRGRILLWSRETGGLLGKLDGHSRRVQKILYATDGRKAYSASADNTVAVWDLGSMAEIRPAVMKHPESVLTMALSPDGKQIVTSAADNTLRLWSTADSRLVSEYRLPEGMVNSLEISRDGRLLAIANAETRQAEILVLPGFKRIPMEMGGSVVDLKKRGALLWAVAFGPEAETLMTIGGTDARLWNLRDGREMMSFSPNGVVASARYSPDNQWIVTSSWDNSVKVWKAATGESMVRLEGGHTSAVNMASFSPDGELILTASDDGTAKLWNWKDAPPKVVKVLGLHTGRVRSAIFNHDGSRIVTTSSDKTARLWDTTTGECLQIFQGHEWPVLSAALSDDGKLLLTGSEDKTARLWNVATGKELFVLAGHTAPVTSVDISPDATRLLTGSQDETVKLWDTRTSNEILTLSRHTQDVTSVAFSPDGRQILTGSRDGTAIIWLAREWRDEAKNGIEKTAQPMEADEAQGLLKTVAAE
ncbi:WD40 repeat domain-containing serine/threonine protein kinase [Planctopirus hydrillae]|uniref:Serine/threonine protein kinase n=1 Tax=Planctopirus hydrillae TaxID=1841610 RepID=A0A1C3E8P4_9PLAN|nr:protein kinase [Planctopirus hydrillae]ODA29612.1 serine/threonine protein kinase [Planctopirus hydrillae]